MEVKKIEDLTVKIFADGAEKKGMLEMYAQPFIKGLTTNPTLMRQAGIQDYRAFAKDVLSEVKLKPISFEVLSDDHVEMERQALEIASWGDNVYVKIPVSNTKKIPSYPLIKKLTKQKVKLNVTAVMSLNQVYNVAAVLEPNIPSYVSIFAGRIADTGQDPLPLMRAAIAALKTIQSAEVIWASPRELLNIFHANDIGCHIITVTNSLLKKLNLIGYCLEQYSLDTVKMFYDDVVLAGFEL